ncbi:MAG: hypothetical protein ACXIU7_12510 [Roseinatronobacter sp.]
MDKVKRRSPFITLFGGLGTLWYAVHAVEYVFARYDKLETRMALPAPLGLQDLFLAMPGWASLVFTFTIWLGLLGAVLLLLGDRASVLILSLALITAIATTAWGAMAYLQGFSPVGGIDPLLFGAGQGAVALGLWLYARTAKRYNTI